MEDYFSIIAVFCRDSDNKRDSSPANITQLRSYFTESSALQQMHPFSQLVLGTNYDRQSCGMFFYPQLLMFFARFFDIYDASIKGNPIQVAMKNVEKQQQVAC